jgi:hypothetical protein
MIEPWVIAGSKKSISFLLLIFLTCVSGKLKIFIQVTSMPVRNLLAMLSQYSS